MILMNTVISFNVSDVTNIAGALMYVVRSSNNGLVFNKIVPATVVHQLCESMVIDYLENQDFNSSSAHQISKIFFQIIFRLLPDSVQFFHIFLFQLHDRKKHRHNNLVFAGQV